MEGAKMFYPEERKKPENPLLKGPELVSPKEKREREIKFSFSSSTRRYYLGHKNGKSFFIIEYFNSLPDELKEKFTKETRKQGEVEKPVYVFKYGEVPKSKEELKEPDPSQSKKYSKYSVAQPRDFERGMIGSFFDNDENKKVISEIISEILKEDHSKLKLNKKFHK